MTELDIEKERERFDLWMSEQEIQPSEWGVWLAAKRDAQKEINELRDLVDSSCNAEELRQVRQELKEYRRDAERYKWLRKKGNMDCLISFGPYTDPEQLIKDLNDKNRSDVHVKSGEALDDEIDYQMECERNKREPW